VRPSSHAIGWSPVVRSMMLSKLKILVMRSTFCAVTGVSGFSTMSFDRLPQDLLTRERR